mgnify:CR=1 FL=1
MVPVLQVPKPVVKDTTVGIELRPDENSVYFWSITVPVNKLDSLKQNVEPNQTIVKAK